jgi:hypothetical protein
MSSRHATRSLTGERDKKVAYKRIAFSRTLSWLCASVGNATVFTLLARNPGKPASNLPPNHRPRSRFAVAMEGWAEMASKIRVARSVKFVARYNNRELLLFDRVRLRWRGDARPDRSASERDRRSHRGLRGLSATKRLGDAVRMSTSGLTCGSSSPRNGVRAPACSQEGESPTDCKGNRCVWERPMSLRSVGVAVRGPLPLLPKLSNLNVRVTSTGVFSDVVGDGGSSTSRAPARRNFFRIIANPSSAPSCSRQLRTEHGTT